MDLKSNTQKEKEVTVINYLLGKLPNDESNAFEKKLETDAALKEQTQKIRNIIGVLKEPELVKAEGKLLELRAQNLAILQSQMNPFKRRWQQWTSEAKTIFLVATVLILVILVFLARTIFGIDGEEFYRAYTKPCPINLNQDAANDPLVDKAFSAYRDSLWGPAVTAFSEIKDRSTTYYFYYTVARIFKDPNNELNNLQMLEDLKTLLEEEKENPYNEQLNYWADYYRALIYIKMGDLQEGKALVNQLYDTDNIYGSLRNKIEEMQEKVGSKLLIFNT